MSFKKIAYTLGQIFIDLIALFCIYLFSYILIGNGEVVFEENFIFLAALYTVFKVVLNIIFLNYKSFWVYNLTKNYIRLYLTSLASIFVVFIVNSILLHFNHSSITFNVFIISAIMEICYYFVSRYAIKIFLTFYYRKDELKQKDVQGKRTLLVGAGSLGAMILNELENKKELGFKVVGILDDNPNKIGIRLGDVKVLGDLSRANEFIDKYNIEDVIIALSSKYTNVIKEFTNSLDYKKVNVHIIPYHEKIISNNEPITIRKIEISDLLGRKPIELDKEGLREFIQNKVVLVTGGGGSIGSEICRQVLDYDPKCLIIFDIYENTVYELQSEINIKYRLHPELEKPNIEYLIGSVRDTKRLDEVFKKYKPDIIFHAAAHKHVPLMEDSPKETIKNNIKGTYNVAKYALKYKAEKMVLISTDKAVNPTNVMGASKRFCEMVVEAFQRESDYTSYSMVRFGNVLGSHGSVIPLFKSQIENGGPITVTSEKINRYFMTIPEACGLVIQSGAFAKGGEKFILDMGEPVKIIDLAKKMVKLSGLELDKDIKIVITGLRPGEKIYEELLLDKSKAEKTENDKIFVEKSKHPLSLNEVDEIIDTLSSMELNNKTMLNYLSQVEQKKKDKVEVM